MADQKDQSQDRQAVSSTTEVMAEHQSQETKDQTTPAADAGQFETSPSSPTRSNEKTPIFKKWWFWLIIAVVIIGIIGGAAGGSGSSNSSSAATASSSASSSAAQQVATPATEGEKAELLAAIDEAKVIDLSLYTSDTGVTLTSAISNAEKVYADSNATSMQVDGALSQLNSAKSLLKEKEKPVVLTGSGDDVVDIPANLSTCLVTAEYSGGSNFVIKSLDKNGDPIDLLVNTIGAYTGTTTTGMKSTTAVYLEVGANGPWTITLSPIADAQTIANGQQMRGDNVVMASTEGASKLTITNAGKSNFVVYGISSSSSKLLVNEIGDYSGTVINSGYSMFIVESEGDWTISW